jgi:low affinity Fe/Cu permease
MKKRFNQAVDAIIRVLGSPPALAAAALIIVAWGISGPLFGFSDTWQLVINTGTTIVTFLMVFVIQNAANRDAKAVHIKLDELITSIDGARNHVVMAEMETEDEQDREIARLTKVAQQLGSTGAAVEALEEAVEEKAEAAAKKSNRSRNPRATPLRATTSRKQAPAKSR